MPITLLDKWLLMQGVVADPELKHADTKIALRLLHHCNSQTGRCDPSYQVLADGAGLSTRSVKDGVDRLERRDWFSVERRRVPGKLENQSNAYRPNIGRVIGGENFAQPSAPNALGGEADDIEGGAKFAPKTKKRMNTEKSNPDFEHWWPNFPKRVAKRAAGRAYEAALKRGATPEALLIEAKRYAAQRVGEDPQFTKHPATWLNGDCWKDEAAPSKGRSSGSAMASATDGLRLAAFGERSLDDAITDAGDQIATAQRRLLR